MNNSNFNPNEEIEAIKENRYMGSFDGQDMEITSGMVDIQVHVKEGFCSASNGSVFVILNTALTEELIEEGIAREIIRKIQSLRKDRTGA